jgi:RHH-type proline utilization regulon transcriptional repressor/proline dehydrogenase/delta 1-pyrroline-5-carboxylate dehydrogenase
VLGLVAVDSLEEAIAIANSSDFGLTGGLHSLEPSQIRLWRETIEVGNAYINRGTTGAIVQRQPFGGWKNSSVGPGVKAGGPNYVACFGKWSETALPQWQAEPLGVLKSLKKLEIN